MQQQSPWEQSQEMPSKPMMPLSQDSMKSKRGTCFSSQLLFLTKPGI
jgi:hypothetical protein